MRKGVKEVCSTHWNRKRGEKGIGREQGVEEGEEEKGIGKERLAILKIPQCLQLAMTSTLDQ